MFRKTVSLLLTAILILSALSAACISAQAAVIGDADGNGDVSILDATHIQRYLAGLVKESEIDMTAADTDRDGEVTILDATVIQRVLAGLATFDGPVDTAIAVCLATEPYTMDPALNSSVDGTIMLSHLFTGLAGWTQDDDGQTVVAPAAAEALPDGVRNADGTVTYTYTLRSGMKWSDGKPVTAKDFAFAWQRAASRELEADYGYLFEAIDGYDAIWEDDEDGSPKNPDAKLNVSAPDDRTLVVTLAAWIPYWEQMLTFPAFFPVREDVAADENWAGDAATYVCNGPYTLASWEHDRQIVIKKNPAYYDAGSITMNTITFDLSQDAEGMLEKFRSGELQMIDDVPFLQAEALQAAYPEEFYAIGGLGTYYVNWNINKELLPADSGLTGAEAEQARAEIRRALSLLIDRWGILPGGAKPASSFVSSGVTDADGSEFYLNAGHNSFTGYFDTAASAAQSNFDAAVQTLKKYYAYDEAAGRFTNFPELTYIYNTSGAHAAIAESIRRSFDSVGIRMTISAVGWSEYQSLLQNGDFSFARNGWIADFDDPICFLDMWTTYAGNNTSNIGRGSHSSVKAYRLDLTPWGYDTKVENGAWAETYDVLIATIKSCTDKNTRYALMHLAEDMLMDTGCITPIYYYTDVFMLSKQVKGFFTNPFGCKFFMYTSVAE